MRRLFDEHLKRVEWDEWQFPVRLYPFVSVEMQTAERLIAIDPKIAFGRPVVIRMGISTETIAERIDAGETVQELASDYDVSPTEIEQAVVYDDLRSALADAHTALAFWRTKRLARRLRTRQDVIAWRDRQIQRFLEKAVVKVETKLDYKTPADTTKSEGLPFRIAKDSTLETKKSSGTIDFDIEKGRITSSTRCWHA